MSNLPTSFNTDEFDIVDTGGPRLSFMRFRKGTYLIGAEQQPLPPGTEFIVNGATTAWIRLAAGAPPERIRKEPGCPFPQRHELPDRDQRFWPKGLNGQPKDPWDLTHEVALTNPSSGWPVVFSISTDTGRGRVEDLIRLIKIQRSLHGPNVYPVVGFGTGTINTRYGPVAIPEFDIKRWVTLDQPAALPSASGAGEDEIAARSAIDPKATTTRPQRRKPEPAPWDDNDLDDEIPF